ncbi:MAG: neutral zinc metallopeptidase [Myxococcota bacterium]
MRWQDRGTSSNVEDRRAGGGRRAAGLGLVGTLLLLVLSVVFQKNFFALTGTTPSLGGGAAPAATAPAKTDPAEERLVKFVSFVLDDVQAVWKTQFRKNNLRYQDARLVLFRGAVESACGFQKSAVGPFYCPADQKAYIDLSFYDELASRFGAPGDFAQAYVLAHEIGHHVQNLTGINTKVRQAQRANPRQKNQLQVAMELQADCYAGIWAHDTKRRNLLEQGDIEEGIGAAAAVGDDTIQKKSRGYVVPESFTHGSAKQRVEAFLKGFKSGDMQVCAF